MCEVIVYPDPTIYRVDRLKELFSLKGNKEINASKQP